MVSSSTWSMPEKWELPNSPLLLLKDILEYCISFVGKEHYQYVGSVWKKINKIYANEHEDIKKTIWRNVVVSKDLVELCLQDHCKLGWTRDQIQSMVNVIG